MWIKTLLIISVALRSCIATKKETYIEKGGITKENFVNALFGRSGMQNETMNDDDSRDTRQSNIPVKQSALISGTSRIDLELLNRRKRGWGSVIFTGVTTALRLGGLGLTLSVALTEGCAYYPSICDNTERMEKLEKKLVPMRSEFNQLYLENKKEYLNIATANTNNAYISFYINETIQSVNTLKNMEKMISDKLETKIPKLYGMFKASENNYTSQEYLDNIIGRLEYRLSDIRNMLKKQKQNQLIGLLIQYLVEAAVSTFIDAFTSAYAKILAREKSQANFFVGADKKKLSTFVKNMKAKAASVKAAAKFKIVSKTLKPIMKARSALIKYKKGVMGMVNKLGKKIEKYKVVKMAKRIGKSFNRMAKTVSSNVKKIFKPGGVSKIFKGAIVKIQKFGLSIKNFSVKDYHVDTSAKVMGVVGIIGDIVSQVINVLGWKKTAEKVQKARVNYEEHYRSFLTELTSVKNEKVELLKSWSGVITIFQRSSSVFRSLIQSGRKYTRFNKVFGINKLPVDTNNPIFNIQFQTLDRTNTVSAQEKVINFLKDTNNDIKRVVNEMRAREIMYEKIETMTDLGNTVDDIFKSITGVLMFSQSKIVQNFGKKLTKKDVMCPISLLRSDLQNYDFFPLGIYRPTCELSSKVYKENAKIATKLRNENLMKVIIEKMNISESHVPLSDLTKLVKNAYFATNNQEISAYGETLTDKDVVCTIATDFPSKQEYDFISLIPFRPDCKKVDDSYFEQLKKEASTVRGISLQIKSTMNTCKSYKFCPCPSMIASMFNITIDQVLNQIKLHAPKMATYCGTTGCSCVNLK